MKGRKKPFEITHRKLNLHFHIERDILTFENTVTELIGENSTPCSLERGGNKCLYFGS